jgi:tRNA(Ile)-lysidine synthase
MSTEEWARFERYAILKRSLQKNEILVTAHHQNDQAETLLLQLFRGAGPKGMAAMPVSTDFGEGQLFRPFLSITRNTLEKVRRFFGLRMKATRI